MRLKGAIFDFDGTLFDSMFIWENAGSDFLRRVGRTPEKGLDKILKPLGMDATAVYLKQNYGLTMTLDKIKSDINDMVGELYEKKVLPKEGVPELLRRLGEKGVRMCVATATDRVQITAALKRCGFMGFFTGICTCSEVGCGKERPDVFEQALRLAGTDKAETLVFEDSVYAVKTAKRAGFRVAGVFDRFEEDQRGLEEISDIYLRGFGDIKGLEGRIAAIR